MAGNDGANGAFYTSSPGNGINAISVASIDNTAVTIQNATVHGVVHDPIPYFNTFPLPVTDTLPIWAVTTDTTVEDDACDPLPDSTPDLSKFVVIVRRGTCTFVRHTFIYVVSVQYSRPRFGCQVQKLDNIAAKGAKVALIYE